MKQEHDLKIFTSNVNQYRASKLLWSYLQKRRHQVWLKKYISYKYYTKVWRNESTPVLKTQEKETLWRKTEGQELVLETAYNK